MVKALLFLLAMSLSVTAFADQKLLDLILSGQARYTIGPECMSGLRNGGEKKLKKIFENLKLKKQKLSELKLPSEYYHYTDNQKIDLNFRDLLEEKFIHERALANAFGPGFYIANEPYSSARYGKTQVKLVVDRDATVVDFRSLSIIEIAQEVWDSDLSTCHMNLLKALILDTAKVDLVLYDKDDMWFSILNESVVKSSVKRVMTGADEISVTQSMIKAGDLHLILPYLDQRRSICLCVKEIPATTRIADMNALLRFWLVLKVEDKRTVLQWYLASPQKIKAGEKAFQEMKISFYVQFFSYGTVVQQENIMAYLMANPEAADQEFIGMISGKNARFDFRMKSTMRSFKKRLCESRPLSNEQRQSICGSVW